MQKLTMIIGYTSNAAWHNQFIREFDAFDKDSALDSRGWCVTYNDICQFEELSQKSVGARLMRVVLRLRIFVIC